MPNPALTNPPTTNPLEEPEPDLPPMVATAPGFRAPPTPKGPDPLDPEATTILPPDPDEPAPWDGSGPDAPGSATSSPDEPAGTSSPASTDPAIFIEVARTAVGIVSIGVGILRARRYGPAVRQAWLADEEDQANIGDPLARIAARRAPAVAGRAAPDVVDGIEAMMGTVNYGMRHAAAEAEMMAAGAGAEYPPADQAGPQ